jgi:hypothetical protein
VLEDARGPANGGPAADGPAGLSTGRTVGRRAVLAASAAVLPVALAACRGVQVLGSPPPPPADVRTLRAAIRAEQLMLARYAAAVARPSLPYPLAVALGTVRAEHSQHLTQLRARLIEPATAAPSPSPSPTVSLPASQRATLTELEQAEQAASDWLLAELADLPPSLAQLFASISAAEATHVPYLHAAGSHR